MDNITYYVAMLNWQGMDAFGHLNVRYVESRAVGIRL